MAEFKDRLREAMNAAGLNQSELAHKAGITQSSVSDWLKGKYLAKQDKVDLLAKALNVSPSWLMGIDTGQSDNDLAVKNYPFGENEETIIAKNVYKIEKRSFPLLGTIAAGEPIFAEQHIEGYIQAGKDINADFCLRVQGDSMTGAHINDGDIVFIRKQPMVRDGQIAAVLVDDEATLKRCYYDRANGIIQLVAENPAYPPMVYTGNKLEDIRILGLAVAHLSMLI